MAAAWSAIPTAAELAKTLGNVALLERPFHPTTLVSVVRSSLRSRRRQYECKRLNEELEIRVNERTAELAAANRQLLRQIEERERVEATLRQMQRLEAVGQLTSGVAHDFNNLLTVVLGNISFLERDFAAAGINGKASQRLSYMRSAAERGAKLTDQLLSFSRRQRLEPRSLDLNETRRQHARPAAKHDGRQHPDRDQLPGQALAGDGRSDPARARDPQPRDQRARRDGGRRHASGVDRQRHARRAALSRGAAARRLRRRPRQGHRHRHERDRAPESVRALLHHQGDRQGFGSRPQPGARLRAAIERRHMP